MIKMNILVSRSSNDSLDIFISCPETTVFITSDILGIPSIFSISVKIHRLYVFCDTWTITSNIRIKRHSHSDVEKRDPKMISVQSRK
jgi:hypothetical protein